MGFHLFLHKLRYQLTHIYSILSNRKNKSGRAVGAVGPGGGHILADQLTISLNQRE